MNILHLSDLHFKKGNKFDQNNIIKKVHKYLKETNECFDFVFFTGDLCNDGIDESTFKEAYESLLLPISEISKVVPQNIFICQGNHDLHRNQEMPAIKSEFDKINSIESLDDFVKSENDRQYQESLRNFQNYTSFHNKLDHEVQDILHPLYTINKRKYGNDSICIVTLNSAWRSTESEKDRGNLFFPISTVKTVLEHLDKKSLNLILMHHSINDFKEYISSEMEDLIFKNFHMLLTGHYHKQKISMNFVSNNGILCSTSPAALTKTNSHNKIGFTKYAIDTETLDVEITSIYYNERTNEFDDIDIQKRFIPTNKEKQEQNKLRKTLRRRYLEEIDVANNLFVSNGETSSSGNFETVFTEPILKTKSKTETIASQGKEDPNVPISTLILNDQSYLLFGKDKSGKTSLLTKIKLELILKINYNRQFPLFIDCKVYNQSKTEIDIIYLLRVYYDLSASKARELASLETICLIIDNYEPSYTEQANKFVEFLKAYPKARCIICTDDTIQRPYNSFILDGITLNKLFIHDIGRREIKLLTEKWCNIKQEKKEIVIQKIIEIFAQLNIPMSFWTVSLFLWVFEKTNEANFHNNFELIQLYIDGLLERKKLALDQTSKITYEDFKAYLGALSHYLLTKHYESNCTATFAEIVAFTEKYRDHKKRFVIGVEDVIHLLIDRGIVKKNSQSKYTFRLNGVFEYFLAYHMNEDPDFKNKAIKDNHFYLSFGNEFELYSGFNKKDTKFVSKVFEKTKLIFKQLNLKYDFSKTDEIFNTKLVDVFDLSMPIQELASHHDAILSVELQEQAIEEMAPKIINEEDVKPKRYYEEISNEEDNLEKALFILSRVYRNSSLSEEKLESSVLDFIINSACNLGFLIIDETEENIENSIIDIIDENNEKQVLKLMANFMPIVVQGFLFDALMQNNLERIIKEKLQKLKEDPSNNQFKIFVLYFLLIDIDAKNGKSYIDEVIKIIDQNVLKQSILLKLYMFLMFKANGNKDFEEYLRKRIEQQSRSINKNIDIDRVDAEVTRQQRIAKLRRSSDKN